MASATEMRNSKVLMELEALAEKLGIQVIQEKLPKTKSGLCRLRNQYMLFIERNLEEDEKVQVMAVALSRFPLDNTQMLPEIRKSVVFILEKLKNLGVKRKYSCGFWGKGLKLA